jgi:hypothetical protein
VLAYRRVRGRKGYKGEDKEDVDREGEGEGMASNRGSFREGTFTSR